MVRSRSGWRPSRPADGSLMLKWEDDLDYFYESVEDDLRDWQWDAATFRADTVVYRVQRSATGPGQHSAGLDDVGRDDGAHVDRSRGTRALDLPRRNDSHDERERLQWTASRGTPGVHMRIQTAEEAAEQARQSAILQAEATRCATATLTSSLQGEPRQIVNQRGCAADRRDPCR